MMQDMDGVAQVRALKRPRKPFPVPQSACVVIGIMGGEIPSSAYNPVTFRLRQRRSGVEIMFRVRTGADTAFSWNVTHLEGRVFRTFKEARSWVRAYAARYGQSVTEVVKERAKRASGEDAKLLRAGGCREAWLESDVPALWAEAQMRCQHPGGFCGADGFCHYGDCDMVMNPAPPQPGKEG